MAGGGLLYIRLTGGAASLIISEQSPEAREGEPPRICAASLGGDTGNARALG